jgi:hypothetical protein
MRAFNPSALQRHWDRLLPLLDRTLRKGAASFVIYRNGSADIAGWGRDATLTRTSSRCGRTLTCSSTTGSRCAASTRRHQ